MGNCCASGGGGLHTEAADAAMAAPAHVAVMAARLSGSGTAATAAPQLSLLPWATETSGVGAVPDSCCAFAAQVSLWFRSHWQAPCSRPRRHCSSLRMRESSAPSLQHSVAASRVF
jgi:hypothetical protein